MRHGCPLSPLLFNILILLAEEELGKVKWGGIKFGKERIITLAYADDVMIMAEGEKEMRNVMKKLEVYLEKKKVEY